MNYKKMAIPVAAVGLIAAGAIWVGGAHAQGGATNQTIIDKLAQKFNLKKDDVQAVFDQNKQEYEQEHQNQMAMRLDQAVKDGVITADQKQKLLDKMAQMQKKRDQELSDMKKWMDESGIDFTKLSGYGVGFGGHGFGGRHGAFKGGV